MTLPATQIMGIVNLSVDSFSGDGCADETTALRHAESLLREGASILDIGAESTRPGATALDAATELQRLLPVLRALVRAFPATPISVDTYKGAVAAAALAEGARMINDITGGEEAALLAAVANAGCPVILMHNAARSGQTEQLSHGRAYQAPVYQNFLQEMTEGLLALAQRAEQAGVARPAIILDPGLGFGKSVSQNVTLLQQTEALVQVGYPLLIGASRKSFIGEICQSAVDDRVVGSAVAAAYAACAGAAYVRVHDVKATRQAIALLAALERPAA